MPERYWLSLLDQARGLSSGTLATLTGFCRYDQLDPIHADFIDFCEENVNRFENWKQAWREYASLKGYKIR